MNYTKWICNFFLKSVQTFSFTFKNVCLLISFSIILFIFSNTSIICAQVEQPYWRLKRVSPQNNPSYPPSPSYTASRNKCSSINLLDQACRYFTNHKYEQNIVLADGSWYPNPVYRIYRRSSWNNESTNYQASVSSLLETRSSNSPNLYQTSIYSYDGYQRDTVAVGKQRIADIFVKAKQAIIASITRGRTYITPEEQSVIDRVQRITLVHGDKLRNDPICQEVNYQAYYKPTNHTVNFCPDNYSLPNAAIAQLLGHEIGHCFDPCNLTTTNIYCEDKVDVRAPPFDIKWNSKCLARNKISAFDMVVLPSVFKKHLDNQTLTLVSASVDFKNYPFMNTYRCMVDKAHFYETNFQNIEYLKRNTYISRYGRDILERAPQCLRDDKTSLLLFGQGTPLTNMTEVIADTSGAIVAADYLKSAASYGGKMSEPEQYAAFAYYGSRLCDGGWEAYSLEQARLSGRMPYPHPAVRKRMNDILFQNPTYMEAIGCDYVKTNGCIESSNISGPASSRPQQQKYSSGKQVI